jgi:hypothetical protein
MARADVSLRRTGRHALLERDGCTAYEPAVTGFLTRNAAKTVLKQLSRGFASSTIERT